MKNLGLEISIRKNALILGKHKHPLVIQNGLLLLKWEPNDHVFYSHDDLRKLHRSFGHPSAKSLANLVRRANPRIPSARNTLEEIKKECDVCAKFERRPCRFKLTMGTEEYRFNHIVAVDIVFIDGNKFLHCVDECTHFGAAVIVRNMKSNTIWKALLKCWSLVRSGHLTISESIKDPILFQANFERQLMLMALLC